jgi:hypothetical protein
VRIEDDRFVATFRWFKVETPLANLDGAHVTRDYRWWTAIGARMSFVDDGLTFGTNSRAGRACTSPTRGPPPRAVVGTPP